MPLVPKKYSSSHGGMQSLQPAAAAAALLLEYREARRSLQARSRRSWRLQRTAYPRGSLSLVAAIFHNNATINIATKLLRTVYASSRVRADIQSCPSFLFSFSELFSLSLSCFLFSWAIMYTYRENLLIY